MPEYLSPGVYVEEFEMGSRPIEGVSTSTAGFLGETERGPTTPQLVTSWLDYQRRFGSYFGATQYLPYEVEGFFANGGQRCYIARIVSETATSASMTLTSASGGDALEIEALGEGSWGNRIAVKAASGTSTGFKLSIFYWKEGEAPSDENLYDPEVDTKTTPRPEVVEIFDDLSVEEESPDYYGKKINGISKLIEITENGELPAVAHKGTAQGGGADSITLASDASDTDDVYNEMQIEIVVGTGKGQTRTISDYDGTAKVAEVSQEWNPVPDDTSEYRLILPVAYITDEGSDGGDVGLDDYEGIETVDIESGSRQRTGLLAFEQIDEISILYAPNPYAVQDGGLINSLINHCEKLKDRFAVIDSSEDWVDISTINPRNNYETRYAAIYYPWIKVNDPEAGLQRMIPPGGYVAGIYARSDTERGVHKAPANESVRGVVGLQFQITKGEHDILNPRNVNVIRAFPGRGIRVWGARTLSSNTLWKYINVRRLFLFIEESIEEGTQWVVFEPNDPKLWARVRATVTEFLTRVWRDGALFGNTPEEAFFVKCDESTMTQDDIDNGRLICVIGVAPVKPAEFVIFRIAQWRGGSEVSE